MYMKEEQNVERKQMRLENTGLVMTWKFEFASRFLIIVKHLTEMTLPGIRLHENI